jgi:hypothetical protein
MATLQIPASSRLPKGILERLISLTKFGTGHRRRARRTPKRPRRLSTMSTLVPDQWEATFFRSSGVRVTFDGPEWFRPSGDLLQVRQDDDSGCLVLVWRDACVELPDGAGINLAGGTWKRMGKLADRWLPMPRISHPWPSQRFRVKHPRWEPYAGKPHVRLCAIEVRWTADGLLRGTEVEGCCLQVGRKYSL